MSVVRCFQRVLPLFLFLSLTPTFVASEEVRTVRVAGMGKATSPPDMATIRTGVTSRRSTASEALAENNVAVRRVMDVLKAFKIAAKDIQTSNFTVRPEIRRNPRGGQQEPEVVGYQVSNQLTAHLRNLPALGELLDKLVEAGSNQISGVTFGIDDPTGVLNQARNRAMTDARARAELYAQAAGVKVGKVMMISEQSAATPRTQPQFRAMAMAESSVPVATGEQEIVATVQVVYQLSD